MRAWAKRAAIRGLGAAKTPIARAAFVLEGARQSLVRWRTIDLAYVPRASDVFIVAYPGSGVALLQMMLYQLTTDGSMDFPHIAAPIPNVERLHLTRRDIEAMPSPRVFSTDRSHARALGGPGRYLYLVRDGGEVAVQYYRLAKQHLGYEGDFPHAFEHFLRGRWHHGSWFDHVAGWWENRRGLSVLFVRHDELVSDVEGSIEKIARFTGLPVDPARMPAIVERSSPAFVKRHGDRFDLLHETLWERAYKPGSFVRRGKSGAGAAELDAEQRAALDREVDKRLAGLVPGRRGG